MSWTIPTEPGWPSTRYETAVNSVSTAVRRKLNRPAVPSRHPMPPGDAPTAESFESEAAELLESIGRARKKVEGIAGVLDGTLDRYRERIDRLIRESEVDNWRQVRIFTRDVETIAADLGKASKEKRLSPRLVAWLDAALRKARRRDFYGARKAWRRLDRIAEQGAEVRRLQGRYREAFRAVESRIRQLKTQVLRPPRAPGVLGREAHPHLRRLPPDPRRARRGVVVAQGDPRGRAAVAADPVERGRHDAPKASPFGRRIPRTAREDERCRGPGTRTRRLAERRPVRVAADGGALVRNPRGSRGAEVAGHARERHGRDAHGSR